VIAAGSVKLSPGPCPLDILSARALLIWSVADQIYQLEAKNAEQAILAAKSIEGKKNTRRRGFLIPGCAVEKICRKDTGAPIYGKWRPTPEVSCLADNLRQFDFPCVEASGDSCKLLLAYARGAVPVSHDCRRAESSQTIQRRDLKRKAERPDTIRQNKESLVAIRD
jgi:hypothetical protein